VVRLGVAANAVEDVVQDVFLVVHRRLPEFRKGSIARTWVYGITIRVVRNYRRTQLRRRRVGLAGDSAIEPAWLPDRADRAPDALVARAQAAALVQRLLGELYDELREVFVLSELEEMTAHEIGQALGVSPNTVYSRLRAARQAFDQALARARARDEWRIR
jgi:RNA polymerase sigma-70 factor (ECF subfamily)